MKRATMLVLAAVFGGLSFATAQDMDSESEGNILFPDSKTYVFNSILSGGCGGSFLGIVGEEVSKETVGELNLPGEYGALVTQVVEESAASKAGLQEKDVIVAYNGTRVESMAMLRRLISETPAGRTVDLTVIRNGSQQRISAELASRSMSDLYGKSLFVVNPEGELEMPESLDFEGFENIFPEGFEEGMEPRFQELEERLMEIDKNFDGSGQYLTFSGINDELPGKLILGVTAQSLSGQLAGYFGLKEGQGGALLSHIHEGYPAKRDGLHAGDVVLAIDDETIDNVGDLPEIISRKEGIIMVKLLREGVEMVVPVDLGSRSDLPEKEMEQDDSQLRNAFPEDGPGLS